MQVLTSSRTFCPERGAEIRCGQAGLSRRFPWMGIPCRATSAPSPSQVVVGVVAFQTHRGESAKATLTRDGHWRCPNLPVLERPLNSLYEPGRFAQAGRPFGHEALDRVAGWLKGRVAERYALEPA